MRVRRKTGEETEGSRGERKWKKCKWKKERKYTEGKRTENSGEEKCWGRREKEEIEKNMERCRGNV